jgi:alkanesulfonate monooxygenase SsuD/methylene tetrahydromethanopterin reductase-like flavin-dependent oxidoreductase (luciferase family)
MASQNRFMTLIAFLQAQNCSNLPGSWRHPSTILDFLTPEYYQRIARTLEDGKIQMAFFDDRLALPDIYTGHHTVAVAAGVRAVKLDPCTIIMAMGMATQRLGLGATYSTTYYEPYHVARLFATMDLMLKGRAAWNIVTSLNSAEARNFGSGEHMAHDARYDRADEFMDVVLGHWNTWEDDALILDKANNRFADPAKVHRLDHVGGIFDHADRSVCAVAAGAAGIDSGGTVGPRPDLCREMGGPGFRDFPQLARRHQGIRRL